MWGSGEMADAHALGACALIGVWVRLPPSPPIFRTITGRQSDSVVATTSR
jgi:hypothetical protein